MLCLAALAGCSTDAPVERTARDTYLVRTHIVGSFSGAAAAQAENARRAADYCAHRGQTPMTIVKDETIGGFLPQDTVTFRCGPAR